MQFIQRNPRFCIPSIVDLYDETYQICSTYIDTITNDINLQNKWLNENEMKSDINVTIIPYADNNKIENEEFNDDGFIYHTKNKILQFVHSKNLGNTINIKGSKTFKIQGLEELKNNHETQTYIEKLILPNSETNLVSIFLELTYNTKTCEVSVRSSQCVYSDKNITLCVFLMKPLQTYVIKSTIMINKECWFEQNCKNQPYNQMFDNVMVLSNFFLNLLYDSIIVNWKQNYFTNENKVRIEPLLIQANRITKISRHTVNNILKTNYYAHNNIRIVKKAQPNDEDYKYIGIYSLYDLFNSSEMSKLAALHDKEIYHFRIHDFKHKILNTKEIKFTQFIDKIEEKKIEMDQHNSTIIHNYIEENNLSNNICIDNTPLLWRIVKPKAR
eukprot:246902_1